MKFSRYSLEKDSGARVASYESLLDLFTLLSFILIIASFFFVTQSTGKDQYSSLITAQVTQRGSGITQTLPKDELVLILYRENSADGLIIIDGTTGLKTNIDVTAAGVVETLKKFEPAFDHNSTINLVSFTKTKATINTDIYFAICRWLTENHHKQFKVYFTDSE